MRYLPVLIVFYGLWACKFRPVESGVLANDDTGRKLNFVCNADRDLSGREPSRRDDSSDAPTVAFTLDEVTHPFHRLGWRANPGIIYQVGIETQKDARTKQSATFLYIETVDETKAVRSIYPLDTKFMWSQQGDLVFDRQPANGSGIYCERRQ